MKMKLILIFLFASNLVGQDVVANSTNAAQMKQTDLLVAKYDLNGNGKIDVNERKPYVQELARQRLEESKAFAAQQPMLNPQERIFYHPPRLTPELIQKYDDNHDGKLDSAERLKISQDASDAAKAEFRRFDSNQDGKLDKEEMKLVRQAKEAERLPLRASQAATNSVAAPTSSPRP
jgi:EF hand